MLEPLDGLEEAFEPAERLEPEETRQNRGKRAKTWEPLRDPDSAQE